METAHVQSRHIAQVVGSFMSTASPMNVVGTFLSVEIARILSLRWEVVVSRVPERARCLIIPIELTQEPVPTDHEVEELEREPCSEHYADRVETDAKS
jgi:hypothetical protein